MLEIGFSGPYALLPNVDETPLLLANNEAWYAGICLWTFLHRQAHRVNFVGVCTHSLAERHNEHLMDFLAGRRTFYESADLAEGTLTPAYRPEEGNARFVAKFPALMNELAQLRIFFAPFRGPEPVLERIGAGIAAHLHQIGPAAQWLDNGPIDYRASVYDEALTVRIRCPEVIADLPEEMHL